MGLIRNHAIVVTSEFDELEVAHAKAKEIFGDFVSEITKPGVNGSRSFLVPPDGSKEFWTDSDSGDNRRTEFIEWMQANRRVCGWAHFVEVAYGEDGDPEICRHPCSEDDDE